MTKELAPQEGGPEARPRDPFFLRWGRWLWKTLELSPEAMMHADPLYMSPALALFALEAEAQQHAAGLDAVNEPSRICPLPRER